MEPTTQPALEPYDISVLGADFPPGLNTADPLGDLTVSETPDGYGYDLTKDGVIAKGTIPTCSSRTLKSVTLTEGALTVPYSWAYNRLWNITNRTASTASTILTYGAHNYEDIYVPQGLGKIYFDESVSSPILAIQPFGQDFMFVATAAGGFVLSNISDTRGFWNKTNLIESMKCGGATGLVELDGVVYAAGTNTTLGLMAYDRGTVTEITRKVRNDLTNFGNVALTVDYEKKYIKGGSSYIYEVPTGKLFRWSTTLFRYTSRQFHLRDWVPFNVDRALCTVKHTDTDAGWFKWQMKVEDRAWTGEEIATVRYDEGEYTVFPLNLEANVCRKFQLRLTDLASNLQIKEIRLDFHADQQDDYSE